MASKSSNQSPVQPAGTMSLPSAVIAILIAFVGGLMIGHLTGEGSGASSEEIALARGDRGGEGAGAGGPSLADDAERFRVDVTDQMPSRGPADALVTIAMFSDFQCPFCSRVEPTIARLVETYGDDIRVVWRNNPLPFHDRATPAAEAAMEAMIPREPITVRMLSPIDPRCTGMCGALAIRAPVASKMAQEKSSRSLMLTE